MHEYNRFDVAGQAIANADWEFASFLHAAEIDTVFDYRWAKDAVREKLLELRRSSLLTGQVVEVEVGEGSRLVNYANHETSTFEEERIVIGTFEGFYTEKTVTRDIVSIKAALPFIDDEDLDKMDRMPLHEKDLVDVQLGIRLKPIIPIPGTDPEKTFIEVPLSEFEGIRFPELDHPLMEEKTVMLELVSLFMQVDAAFAKSKSLDEVYEQVVQNRDGHSAMIGREMLLFIKEGSREFEANLNDAKFPIDVPILKRLACKLIGFAVDIFDPEIGAEPLALVSELDTGELAQIPLASIAEGALLDVLPSERDMRLFSFTRAAFDAHVQHILQDHSSDHERAYTYLQDVCYNMSTGDDPIVGKDIVIQTYRDTPYETSNADYSDPGIEPNEDELEEVHDIALGESFSLTGRLVGYRCHMLGDDYDRPLDEFDIQLVAVIIPDSTLFHLLNGLSVLVPVEAIKNSRLGIVNYN